MDEQTSWGALITGWVVVAIFPYFWLTTREFLNKKSDASIWGVLGPWAVGFVVLMTLWRQDSDFKVGAWFSGSFAMAWLTFVMLREVRKPHDNQGFVASMGTRVSKAFHGGWARLALILLLIWEVRWAYRWWDLNRRCCYGVSSGDISEAALIVLFSPAVALLLFLAGKWTAAGFRNSSTDKAD